MVLLEQDSEKSLGMAGIRAGMFVRDAKARCPDLEIVPYNFEAYEQVADQVYDILHRHCSTVQASATIRIL
jgi:nucleotidyltransferase/DNA polymerase involved in DNA repair